MTNESKRRRVTTSVPIAATDQQLVVSNTHSKGQGEAHSKENRKRRTRITDIPSKSDHGDDLWSSMKGDMKRIIRYAGEILHHDRSIVELRPDGSIVITPRPRQLPNEIVSLIMHHLHKQPQHHDTLFECALVSRQFYVISNPLLWKYPHFPNSVDVKCFVACITKTSKRRLQTLGQHIDTLTLCGRPWTDIKLSLLLPHIPRLKHLTFYGDTRITDTCFEQLPLYCQHLTTLHFAFNDKHLSHASFSAIGQHCHQLRQFQWCLWGDQSPEWLCMLTSCPLERLALWSHSKPVHAGIMAAIQKFDHLTSLTIEQHSPADMKFLLAPPATTTTSTTTTTTTITTAPAIPFPQLTKLTLAPCDSIDDATWLAFIKTHPHLKDIELTKAYHLTDTILDAMTVWLPHLSHFSITRNENISSNGVRRFILNGPSDLAYLKLFYCDRVLQHELPEFPILCVEMIRWERKTFETIRQACKANDNNDNNRDG